MALSGTESILGPALKAAIDGVSDKTDRDALFQAMAKAIIDHLVNNAAIHVDVIGVQQGPATIFVTNGTIA